jgi:AcrR family transcriptional regulator
MSQLQLGDLRGRERILRVALHLFVREGFSRTSIRDIGAAAGLSNPALYKHFASKEALALLLFERCYGELFEVLSALQRGEGSFEERFDAFVNAFGSLLAERLDALLFVSDTLREFWPKLSGPLKRRSLLGITRGLVRQGQREGAVDAGVDVELLTALLGGTLSQVARMLFFGELENGAPLEQLKRVLRRALAPPRAPPEISPRALRRDPSRKGSP